jgi:hypothetical protein
MRAAMPKDEKSAKQRLAETRPDLERGDEVVVEENGIRPWNATVVGVKPSLVSGWWVTLRDDRGEWAMPAERVRRGEA